MQMSKDRIDDTSLVLQVGFNLCAKVNADVVLKQN